MEPKNIGAKKLKDWLHARVGVIIDLPKIKKNYGSRPRWSSGLIRHVIRPWMRKVVGSNLGDDYI